MPSSKIGQNSPSSSSSSFFFFFFFFFLRNWPRGLLGRRWEVILSQIFSGIVCARSFHYYDRRTSRPLLSLTRTISDLNKEPWKWCHFLIDHAVKEGVAARGHVTWHTRSRYCAREIWNLLYAPSLYPFISVKWFFFLYIYKWVHTIQTEQHEPCIFLAGYCNKCVGFL